MDDTTPHYWAGLGACWSLEECYPGNLQHNPPVMVGDFFHFLETGLSEYQPYVAIWRRGQV